MVVNFKAFNSAYKPTPTHTDTHTNTQLTLQSIKNNANANAGGAYSLYVVYTLVNWVCAICEISPATISRSRGLASGTWNATNLSATV